jgi:hypothetical protein
MNLGEELKAECISIAVNTDLPDALKPNAITNESPITMSK